jgi:uncharacterized membrane protein
LEIYFYGSFSKTKLLEVNYLMERMLVVVFDNELKAYDGSRALKELDSEGSISVHAGAVIVKNADGKVTVKQAGEDFPVRTVGGTAVGALIGLLGGPLGFVVGAAGGTIAGGMWDMYHSGVNAEFLDEVSAKLTPGKWAVVSDVSEEWETPVDTRMAAVGGTVFRVTRKNIEDAQRASDAAVMKADIAQLKAEQAKARADEKAKIQSKIDNLNKKLHVKAEQAKQRSKQRQDEAKAKVDALEKKAAKAKGDAKAKIEARIAEIKKEEKETEDAVDKWWYEEIA